MKKKPYHDFYTAFNWLRTHPSMWYWGPTAVDAFKYDSYDSAFPSNLDIDVVKVNPETDSIDDDDNNKNVAVRIWIEPTTYTDIDDDNISRRDDFTGSSRHDYILDCGGATYEEAIIELADRVWEFYGLYGKPEIGVWGREAKRVMDKPDWYPKYAEEDRKTLCGE